MRGATITRFYRDVAVVPQDGLFCIALDGRLARTVGRRPLGAPRQPLAAAMADEWASQEGRVDLATMPLSRLQGFVLDGGEAARGEWHATVLNFAASDLLCHHDTDKNLAARQLEVWRPILSAVERILGVRFAVTAGVMAVPQPDAVAEVVGRFVDDMPLSGVFAAKLMTEIFGSCVLTIAVMSDIIPWAEGFAASRLDETYQAEKWGVDAEAAAREERLRADLEKIVQFWELSSARAS